MDKRIPQIGEKSAVFIKLREARGEKEKKALEVKPEKRVVFDEWMREKQAFTEEEKKQMARSIVSVSSQEISSSWNKKLLEETVWKKLMALSLDVRCMLLPYIQDPMEAEVYNRDLNGWTHRADSIGQSISNLESSLPPEFSTTLIGHHKDYPNERCIDPKTNQIYDVWLTELMGEKRPTLFSPRARWEEMMEQFYSRVYLPAYEKERAVQTPVVETPPPPPPTNEQASAIHGFFSEGEEETGTPGGKVSRIYKGGK